MEETTLKTAEIQVERKTFRLTLKENPLGRFVRVTEMGTRKNSIIIPATGVEGFCQVLGEMKQSEMPPLKHQLTRYQSPPTGPPETSLGT